MAHARAVQSGAYQGITPGQLKHLAQWAQVAEGRRASWALGTEIRERLEGTLILDGALWSVRWGRHPKGNTTWGRTIYEICAWLNYEAANRWRATAELMWRSRSCGDRQSLAVSKG